ncbi:MAG: YbaB/EbfC family nucleoid-associated protein [Rhodospirillaceae bacterium]|nr:YbaB/EbfC family nucleoid-associated protein [Rhodospirillaceae bacterium]
MKNLGQMLKQAQEVQGKIERMQEELAAAEIEGKAGGGMVSVTLNGKGHMLRLRIDPALCNPDEADVLEDLLLAAHNDARTRAEDYAQEEMRKVTGGLNLPPGMKLPF